MIKKNQVPIVLFLISKIKQLLFFYYIKNDNLPSMVLLSGSYLMSGICTCLVIAVGSNTILSRVNHNKQQK